MTQLEAVFLHNPFTSVGFRRRRKLIFLLDQMARLTALDADGFAARLKLSQAIAQLVSDAMSDTGSALNQQMGATVDSDAAFENVRKVAGQQFAILQATLGKGSTGLVNIFGRHIMDYTEGLTHSNAVQRLPTLLKNVGTNAEIAGPVAVKALTDAIKQYTNAHTDQGGDKGTVATHRASAASLDGQLNQVLWQNQTAVVDRYPTAADDPQRLAAADYNLLSPPAPGHHSTTFADYLPAGTTHDVDEDDPQPLPAPTTRLVLSNPGAVRLQVALSASHTDFPAAGIVQEVAPGATVKIVLADLGDSLALPFLLVRNPTSELGQYKVVLG